MNNDVKFFPNKTKQTNKQSKKQKKKVNRGEDNVSTNYTLLSSLAVSSSCLEESGSATQNTTQTLKTTRNCKLVEDIIEEFKSAFYLQRRELLI